MTEYKCLGQLPLKFNKIKRNNTFEHVLQHFIINAILDIV